MLVKPAQLLFVSKFVILNNTIIENIFWLSKLPRRALIQHIHDGVSQLECHGNVAGRVKFLNEIIYMWKSVGQGNQTPL